ncbi:hypothetical protein, partial [Streptomyces guryensis]
SPRPKPAENGVSTYLALIFGTLLSSQGTDASFVLTLSGFPPGSFPSVLRFRLYQTVSRSDFLGAFQVPAFAFPFPAAPTLSEVSSRTGRPLVSDSSGVASSEIDVSEKQTDAHRCRPD